MANNIEHLFICLAIYIFFSVKNLCMSFAHLLIRFFSMLSFENSLHILDMSSLLYM